MLDLIYSSASENKNGRQIQITNFRKRNVDRIN